MNVSATPVVAARETPVNGRVFPVTADTVGLTVGGFQAALWTLCALPTLGAAFVVYSSEADVGFST